jgi:hypothetical protein
MKKEVFLLAFLVLFTVNIFAGGIQEHGGQNYFISILGGAYAVGFSDGSLEEDVLVDLRPAIVNNQFHFFGIIAPANPDEVLRRGYFQNGDKFLLTDEFPNILATYIGVHRNTSNTFIEREERNCWGFGYSIYRGQIYITELILTQEEYDRLNL